MRGAWIFMAAAVFPARAEIIDRVAVRVDKHVISDSAVRREIRLVALIEGIPADFTPGNRRRTAERLVDQWLIRREMEITRKPQADSEAVEEAYAHLKQEGFGGDDARYRTALARYGLHDEDVRAHILRQVAVVRFLSVRFRPGIQIADNEIEDYFQREVAPKLRARAKRSGKSAPAFVADEYRDDIEQKLIEQHVDQQAEEWLKGTRERTFIEFLPEAFK